MLLYYLNSIGTIVGEKGLVANKLKGAWQKECQIKLVIYLLYYIEILL